MISTNYSGRQIDVLIAQGAKPVGEQQLTLEFGDDPQVITGIQQTTQTFIMLFLTMRGSVLSEPLRGSSFIKAMVDGRIQTESDIQLYFSKASDEVLSYLNIVNENEILRDDEIIISAVLDNFELRGDTVILYVTLTTLAGRIRDIILPVKAVII